jgi:hypothetical protein
MGKNFGKAVSVLLWKAEHMPPEAIIPKVNGTFQILWYNLLASCYFSKDSKNEEFRMVIFSLMQSREGQQSH